MNTAPSSLSLSGGALTKWLVIITIAVLVLFQSSFYRALARHSVSPETILQGKVPDYFDPQTTLKFEDGYLGQFVIPSKNTKLYLLVLPHPAYYTGSLIDAGKRYAGLRTPLEGLPEGILKFLAAQVDLRRVTRLEPRFLAVGSHRISAERFHLKSKEYYEVALFQRPDKSVLLLALSLDSEVDHELLQRVFTDVGVFQENP
jgi:hypothetical protein